MRIQLCDDDGTFYLKRGADSHRSLKKHEWCQGLEEYELGVFQDAVVRFLLHRIQQTCELIIVDHLSCVGNNERMNV